MDTEYVISTSNLQTIADAIREKLNDNKPITVANMADKISQIQGTQSLVLSEITLQPKAITFTVVPEEGYNGIGSVTILGDENLKSENIKLNSTIFGVNGSYSPDFKSQYITKEILTNGSFTISPDEGFDGIHQVKISTKIPSNVNNDSKTIVPSATTQTVSYDSSKYTGLSSVIVQGDSDLKPSNIRNGVNIFGVTGEYGGTLPSLQTRAITPGATLQTISATEGYDGLSEVRVYGDSNLIPENIKSGVTIFNTVGSFIGEPYYSELQTQTINITPSNIALDIYPDPGYVFDKIHVNTDENLSANNIKQGISIFGVNGAYSPSLKTLTVIPNLSRQHILPNPDYDGFSSVIVEAVGDLSSHEWVGTKDEYDALESYDSNTTYYIREENVQ